VKRSPRAETVGASHRTSRTQITFPVIPSGCDAQNEIFGDAAVTGIDRERFQVLYKKM
jgi:hypothetical protein